MGRKAISLIIVITLLLAFAVFLKYSHGAKKKTLPDDSGARIIMENFSYHRYESASKEVLVSSKIGKVTADSRVLLEGEVQAIRKNKDKSDAISSNSATAYFEGGRLIGTNSDAELEKIEFKSDVTIRFAQYTIMTESAVYSVSRNTITSKDAVTIKSNNRIFSSDGGFKYQIKTEDLEMYGNIEGEFERKS